MVPLLIPLPPGIVNRSPYCLSGLTHFLSGNYKKNHFALICLFMLITFAKDTENVFILFWNGVPERD